MHSFKNEDLFQLWIQSTEKHDKVIAIYNYIKENTGGRVNSSNEDKIKQQILRLCRNFENRWSQANRHKDYFNKTNSSWLQKYFLLKLPKS